MDHVNLYIVSLQLYARRRFAPAAATVYNPAVPGRSASSKPRPHIRKACRPLSQPTFLL